MKVMVSENDTTLELFAGDGGGEIARERWEVAAAGGDGGGAMARTRRSARMSPATIRAWPPLRKVLARVCAARDEALMCASSAASNATRAGVNDAFCVATTAEASFGSNVGRVRGDALD